ncbi:isochorismate synthase [Ornithinibacillus halophilus]|uniref:Isochorismate synthase MenF n=1 Tax=Ornithinibacillus halophilus TaxID=930117 RepID=A0A1M5K6I5_9BACI|nr:isochorismate synthase [Ornithinibacillus halophilus]SHG48418.1 isochorismate synthase [Ornithinibacillus halophilus]
MLELKEEQLESILEKGIKQAKNIQLVSVTKKIPTNDPVSIFNAAKIMKKQRSYWRSAEDNFTVVGVGSAFEIKTNKNTYQETDKQWNSILRDAIIHNPFKNEGTGLVAIGGMSFDSKKEKTALWNNFDDSQFVIPEFVYVQNNVEAYLTINVRVNGTEDVTNLSREIQLQEDQLLTETVTAFKTNAIVSKTEVEPQQWKKTVQLATEEMKKSDVAKIVLARELRVKLSKEAHIESIIQDLVNQQPNSYVFAFEYGEDCFIGATPERLVKKEKSQLLSTCLAGTAPRGKDVVEDEKIRKGLLNDKKNREEHDFVVQMIRKAITPFARDIAIPDAPVVLQLKNMHHLYTPVTGIIKENSSLFDIVEKLHPTPALGGTPKEEALSFIREHELLDRGWYGAPIGWLDSNENGEFAVAIRSGLIQKDEASLFAGCGVVADSNPEAEYEETNIKFTPMLSVLGG